MTYMYVMEIIAISLANTVGSFSIVFLCCLCCISFVFVFVLTLRAIKGKFDWGKLQCIMYEFWIHYSNMSNPLPTHTPPHPGPQDKSMLYVFIHIHQSKTLIFQFVSNGRYHVTIMCVSLCNYENKLTWGCIRQSNKSEEAWKKRK